MFLFLICSKNRIHYLQNVDVYLALLCTLTIFSPVIIWNIFNKGAPFLYQINNIITLHSIQLMPLFRYLFHSFIFMNPLISGAILYYSFVERKYLWRNYQIQILFLISTSLVLFFCICSLGRHIHVTWDAIVGINCIILLATVLEHQKKYNLIILLAHVAIILFSSIFIVIVVMNKLPIKITRLLFEAENTSKMYNQATAHNFHNNSIIIACDWRLASMLWYRLNKKVYVLKEFPRANNFAYQNSRLKFPIASATYFCFEQYPDYMDKISLYFTSIQERPVVKTSDGTLYSYDLENPEMPLQIYRNNP